MRVRSALVVVLLAAKVLVAAQASGGTPIVRNPGEPSYDVELRGGRIGHVWAGTETVRSATSTPPR